MRSTHCPRRRTSSNPVESINDHQIRSNPLIRWLIFRQRSSIFRDLQIISAPIVPLDIPAQVLQGLAVNAKAGANYFSNAKSIDLSVSITLLSRGTIIKPQALASSWIAAKLLVILIVAINCLRLGICGLFGLLTCSGSLIFCFTAN